MSLKYEISACEFGLKVNESCAQTKAIQAAIDFCYERGGGIVVIPAGEFITGGIRLRSDVYLRLLGGARLKGTRDPQDYCAYREDMIEPFEEEDLVEAAWTPAGTPGRVSVASKPGSRWNNALIRAYRAQNTGVIGEEGAIIDGSDCYDEQGEEYYRGPHGISLWHCRNVRLSGYTIQNSGNWAHAIFCCENVAVDNVTVLAGHDGIHLKSCKNVRVTQCGFYTGDDCVAGTANLNVYVGECIMNSACSALRFGGTNVLVEKCKMFGPCRYFFRGSLTLEEKKRGAVASSEGKRRNMLSAFTYFADFSFPIEMQPGNIILSDCEIDYADRLLHYNFSGNETWQKNRPLKSLQLHNIKATNICMTLTAYGSKEVPLELEITNSEISFRDGAQKEPFMQANHYEKIVLKNIVIKNNESEPLILTWQREGGIEMSNIQADNTCVVELSQRPFECQAI